MKKGILIYSLSAVGFILSTGILAMLLGILELFTEETNQYIVETISGLLGAAFLTFLFARIKTKQWERKWTRKESQRYLLTSLAFFGCRTLNRFMLNSFLSSHKPGIGYTSAIMADICLIVGLYLLLPKHSSEADTSKKDAATKTMVKTSPVAKT